MQPGKSTSGLVLPDFVRKDWVAMDWLDLNTLTYWGAILAAIVAIGTPLGTIRGWLKKPLDWFRSHIKSKVRQKSVSLIFAQSDFDCRWSEGKQNDQSATIVYGRWHVTNASESDVTIQKARMSKYETSLVQILTGDPNARNVFGGNFPILYHNKSEVSVIFTFFPPIAQTPKPINSDVIFTDNFSNEYRVPTEFTYIGPKAIPSPSLWSRWFQRWRSK
jgi:hypothetical protein